MENLTDQDFIDFCKGFSMIFAKAAEVLEQRQAYQSPPAQPQQQAFNRPQMPEWGR